MSRFSFFKSSRSLLKSAAKISMAVAGLCFSIGIGAASVNAVTPAFTEGFDNITTLPSSGWFTQNNSVPVGTSGWFQGNSTVFPAQAGAATSYIGANFNNTTGTNTISNWLLTPAIEFRNGDTITFYTRTSTAAQYPDRLQVRLSTAGTSTNVGTGNEGVGDFTTILRDINPTLAIGGYPETWTQITVTISGLSAQPTVGRIGFRYYVTNGGPAGDNSNYIGIDTFAYNPAPALAPGDANADFNGDGKSDYAVVRTAGAQKSWYIQNNGAAGSSVAPFGSNSDVNVPEDYDGDGRDDIAVWRSGSLAYTYILQSSNNTVRIEQFGTVGDDPRVAADYDGDNKSDVAVFRATGTANDPCGVGKSVWYYRPSATAGVSFRYSCWGQSGDVAAPGDYDGDGKNDFAVARTNGTAKVFYISKSAGGTESVSWGNATDAIIPGDYDGDGKSDLAVGRVVNGLFNWFILTRTGGGTGGNPIVFGLSTDVLAPGDYDGDGKQDIAVWRGSADSTQNFYLVRSSQSGGLLSYEWGQQNDIPAQNWYVH